MQHSTANYSSERSNGRILRRRSYTLDVSRSKWITWFNTYRFQLFPRGRRSNHGRERSSLAVSNCWVCVRCRGNHMLLLFTEINNTESIAKRIHFLVKPRTPLHAPLRIAGAVPADVGQRFIPLPRLHTAVNTAIALPHGERQRTRGSAASWQSTEARYKLTQYGCSMH